jgi:hypothetical protein
MIADSKKDIARAILQSGTALSQTGTTRALITTEAYRTLFYIRIKPESYLKKLRLYVNEKYPPTPRVTQRMK